MPNASDTLWMQRALELAELAAQAGEVPVGAVVVRDNRVVGEGWNQPISAADPSAHAEIKALRAAASALANYRLPGCDLYVTLEPCTMCVGAIVHARIRRVIFAASEPKAGVIGSNGNLLEAPYLNHKVQWEGGVCAAEASELLQRFFRERRQAKQKDKTSAADAVVSVNNEQHLEAFIRLNEEWITKYFQLEQVDLDLSINPKGIMDAGGFIFSAEKNGDVVGVCALFKVDDELLELARMAVTERAQGEGYGKLLLQHAITTAREAGAKKLRLLSNTKLDAAITLYKTMGFKTISKGQHPQYQRCNIVMELSLNNS